MTKQKGWLYGLIAHLLLTSFGFEDYSNPTCKQRVPGRLAQSMIVSIYKLVISTTSYTYNARVGIHLVVVIIGDVERLRYYHLQALPCNWHCFLQSYSVKCASQQGSCALHSDTY